jgi:CRP-like cAMP-binding protein
MPARSATGSNRVVAEDTTRTVPEVLASTALFAGLCPEILQQLAATMKPQRLSRGNPLFRAGDPGEHLFVIRSGAVQIVRVSPLGQEAILQILREGDTLGEMALFDAQPRSADAVAVRETRLLCLHREDLRALIHRYPQMTFPILRTLTQRLRRTTDLLEESLFFDLRTRLARLLLRLAADHGKDTGTGVRIDLHLSQQDLAQMLGASRARVNEHMNDLRRRKLLDFERNHLIIPRPAALQRLAE